MSTTTMISKHHRRFVTPASVGPPNKRKERDGFDDAPKPTIKKPTRPITPRPGPSLPAPKPNVSQPASNNNQLLAGYLAHEFLTKGTLFGQPWDPAAAAAPEGPKPPPPGYSQKANWRSSDEEKKRHERYVEVGDLLKRSGAYFPGIVNPTQLARFLKL